MWTPGVRGKEGGDFENNEMRMKSEIFNSFFSNHCFFTIECSKKPQGRGEKRKEKTAF